MIRLLISRRSALGGSLVVLLLSCGCGSSGKSPSPSSPTQPAATVTALKVTGTASFTTAGQTAQLVATATLSDGTSQTVTTAAAWQSSNTAVATVSTTGTVTAVAPGSSTITATYQSVSGTLALTWNFTIDPTPYVQVENGTLPIVISAPHGGTVSIPGVPVRTTGTISRDLNVLELANATQAQLAALTGKRAYLVAALASRQYVDFNRAANEAYESATVASVYDAYYVALQRAVSAARGLGQNALLVDLHGQSDNVSVCFRGTRNGQTATVSALYVSPDGLLARLMSLGVNVDPSTASGTENASFNGGNIVVTQGLSAGGIHAVQLEFGSNYRQSSVVNDTASKIAQALASWVSCSNCR